MVYCVYCFGLCKSYNKNKCQRFKKSKSPIFARAAESENNKRVTSEIKRGRGTEVLVELKILLTDDTSEANMPVMEYECLV